MRQRPPVNSAINSPKISALTMTDSLLYVPVGYRWCYRQKLFSITLTDEVLPTELLEQTRSIDMEGQFRAQCTGDICSRLPWLIDNLDNTDAIGEFDARDLQLSKGRSEVFKIKRMRLPEMFVTIVIRFPLPHCKTAHCFPYLSTVAS